MLISIRRIRYGTAPPAIVDPSIRNATRLFKSSRPAIGRAVNRRHQTARSRGCGRGGAGRPTFGIAADRFARAAVRVALRQLQAVKPGSPALAAWLSAHDPLDPRELNDLMASIPAQPDCGPVEKG